MMILLNFPIKWLWTKLLNKLKQSIKKKTEMWLHEIMPHTEERVKVNETGINKATILNFMKLNKKSGQNPDKALT